MTPFSLEMPRAVHFGPGSISKLEEAVRQLGTRVLLLTGSRWLGGSQWNGEVERVLAGCLLQRLSCPPGEPTVASVDAAAEQARAFRPDAIVAVGGGSVLDTAKALSAAVRHGGSAERFLEGLPESVAVPGPGIPWIAVPTTAGTGAEATKNAVIKSDAAGAKRSMRSPHLLASTVLVDPALTLSLPPAVTGTSGLDAFTQLLEAYVSRRTTLPVRSLVRGAFHGMWEALDGLARAPADAGLREKASYGAFVSGVALANAGLGAAHGLAAAVGGAYDVPHGLACAVFLPQVLQANREVIAADLRSLLADSFGAEASNDPVEWLAFETTRLLAAYGLPTDLRKFAIPRQSLPELARKASGSSMRGNPRELELAERERILARVV